MQQAGRLGKMPRPGHGDKDAKFMQVHPMLPPGKEKGSLVTPPRSVSPIQAAVDKQIQSFLL
jgi:hypothetical protein